MIVASSVASLHVSGCLCEAAARLHYLDLRSARPHNPVFEVERNVPPLEILEIEWARRCYFGRIRTRAIANRVVHEARYAA